MVYFSRAGENWQVGNVERGNTAIMVDYIKELANVDVFEIVLEKSYPEDYMECVRYVNDVEIPQNLRPCARIYTRRSIEKWRKRHYHQKQEKIYKEMKSIC